MHDLHIVQIQPRNHVLDDADHTASTQQQELDHTDHTGQESICPAWQILIMNCSGNRLSVQGVPHLLYATGTVHPHTTPPGTPHYATLHTECSAVLLPVHQARASKTAPLRQQEKHESAVYEYAHTVNYRDKSRSIRSIFTTS